MSYSPSLSSGFTFAQNRSRFISPQSGMCSYCTEECPGTCEIAQAAVLGASAVYPSTTGTNQIASEKNYPFDYSHFNIAGHVFGADGVLDNYEQCEIYNVNLHQQYGKQKLVKMELPFILPALIKLNWKDYFGGAAMAGVTCMIGEDARNKDPNLKMKGKIVTEFPLLRNIMDSFEHYDRGYGQIVLQCNADDHIMGIPELAAEKYGVKALEFKFGQSAKGTQPVVKLKNYQQALEKRMSGMLVRPDPLDSKVKQKYEEGICPNFYSYARLPQWTEESISKRIQELRQCGITNIYFKMAGYHKEDIERVMRMACANQVDMITFDGAGGGSGYSPSKMMNEWSYPTIMLENIVVNMAKTMKSQNLDLPAIVITGGFASEDQVFKAIALGDGFVSAIGLCRGSMAAAMTGASIGAQMQSGTIPERFKKFGGTYEEIFGDLPDLRAIYGKEANKFSPGAVGVFSYLNKLAFGVRHFAALNRKFDLKYLNKEDLIPLTPQAEKIL